MNQQQLQRAIGQLKGWREYAFLLALSERQFPNYALFAEVMQIPYGARLRSALDDGWQMLAVKDHKIDAFRLLTRVEQICPDPEKYDMYGVYPAYTACKMLEAALLSRCNPDKRRAAEAAQEAFDSVVRFVEVSEGEGMSDDELVRLFDQHEFIRVERDFQRALLERLRSQRVPDEAFVGELRELAANDGVSNLGIGLDQD